MAADDAAFAELMEMAKRTPLRRYYDLVRIDGEWTFVTTENQRIWEDVADKLFPESVSKRPDRIPLPKELPVALTAAWRRPNRR